MQDATEAVAAQAGRNLEATQVVDILRHVPGADLVYEDPVSPGAQRILTLA